MVDLAAWAAWRWAGRRRALLATATAATRGGGAAGPGPSSPRPSTGRGPDGGAPRRPPGDRAPAAIVGRHSAGGRAGPAGPDAGGGALGASRTGPGRTVTPGRWRRGGRPRRLGPGPRRCGRGHRGPGRGLGPVSRVGRRGGPRRPRSTPHPGTGAHVERGDGGRGAGRTGRGPLRRRESLPYGRTAGRGAPPSGRPAHRTTGLGAARGDRPAPRRSPVGPVLRATGGAHPGRAPRRLRAEPHRSGSVAGVRLLRGAGPL